MRAMDFIKNIAFRHFSATKLSKDKYLSNTTPRFFNDEDGDILCPFISIGLISCFLVCNLDPIIIKSVLSLFSLR
jgi:hypothetical protein